jgi:hypothetical protein
MDYLQLIHAIREGLDLDGDGAADLKPRSIAFAGQSLGSFCGAIVTAMSADIEAAVFNVGGGSIIET